MKLADDVADMAFDGEDNKPSISQEPSARWLMDGFRADKVLVQPVRV